MALNGKLGPLWTIEDHLGWINKGKKQMQPVRANQSPEENGCVRKERGHKTWQNGSGPMAKSGEPPK